MDMFFSFNWLPIEQYATHFYLKKPYILFSSSVYFKLNEISKLYVNLVKLPRISGLTYYGFKLAIDPFSLLCLLVLLY